MMREVQSELLDELPADNPLAQQSRRDLRRVNRWMGNASLLARALLIGCAGRPIRRVADLGCGDGYFMLGLARSIAPSLRNAEVCLVDRGDCVASEALQELRGLGLRVLTERRDVFDWLSIQPENAFDLMVANLFLHHFDQKELAELLARVSRVTQVFAACEPRRSTWALLGSRMVGAIGCNAVTRHDAVRSVRAGFSGQELTHLWPRASAWTCRENPAGLFSHCFVAWRSFPIETGSME